MDKLTILKYKLTAFLENNIISKEDSIKLTELIEPAEKYLQSITSQKNFKEIATEIIKGLEDELHSYLYIQFNNHTRQIIRDTYEVDLGTYAEDSAYLSYYFNEYNDLVTEFNSLLNNYNVLKDIYEKFIYQ